jgi:hypothetical protein
MRHLATWSRRRIQVLWLAWFGLLAGLFVLDVWRQWQRHRSAAPESAAMANRGTKPLGALPEQHTDLVYSVVADDVALLKTVLIIIGPPGLLTVLWLYVRHRWRPRPPASKRMQLEADDPCLRPPRLTAANQMHSWALLEAWRCYGMWRLRSRRSSRRA